MKACRRRDSLTPKIVDCQCIIDRHQHILLDSVRMNTEPEPISIRKRRRYTQAERRALSDRRIMEAALKLIARQGSNRTTLAEVGEAAGYSYGLVTNRFGSKAGLIEAVLKSVQTHFALRALPEMGNVTGIEALKVLIDAYLTKVESVGRRALYVLMGEALGPVPEIRADMTRADRVFRHSLQRHIKRGIESGEIKLDIDPARQAALLLATLRGISLQSLLDPSAIDLSAVSRDLQANIEVTFARSPKMATATQ